MEQLVQALMIAAITAAVTALASAYVTGKVLDAKINGMLERLAKAEGEILKLREWRHDVAGNMGWIDQERRREMQDRRDHDRSTEG